MITVDINTSRHLSVITIWTILSDASIASYNLLIWADYLDFIDEITVPCWAGKDKCFSLKLMKMTREAG